jgi:hypothetical protein
MAVTGIAAAGIFLGSRRWALLSAALGILYLTLAQSIQVAGFTVYAFRILAMALFVRVVWRKEFPPHLNQIDRLLLAAYLYFVIVFLLRAREGEGYAYQIGIAVDTFLWYFSFRALLKSIDDYHWLLRGLVFLLVPYAGFVFLETTTWRNHFAAIGGVELVNAGEEMWFRNGRLRALGTFGNPSLLGTVAATFFPLYLSLWFSRLGRGVALAGGTTCLLIVWASNSGGPIGCIAFAAAGWAMWSLRRHMRGVRVSMVLVLLALGVTMDAPIWYLLAKLSAATGGDGWHRAALLDVAFQNLDKWWLAGMPAAETSTWLPYTNTSTGAVDMTNNFLVFGVASGLGAMALLIALVVQAFRSVGGALAMARQSETKPQELLLWGIGVMLATHIFNWFAITYWDQSNLIWLLHLALVSSLTQEVVPRQTSTALAAEGLEAASPSARVSRVTGHRSGI